MVFEVLRCSIVRKSDVKALMDTLFVQNYSKTELGGPRLREQSTMRVPKGP